MTHRLPFESRLAFLSLSSTQLVAIIVAAAGGIPAGGATFAVPASAPVPGIIEIGSRRQTFLDNLVIHEASKLSMFVTRPHKYEGNPIIVPDRPWEQGTFSYPGGKPYPFGIQITGQSVLFDDEEGIFKMWYIPWPWDDGRRPLCYATSRDGYRWEKPELGLYEFGGSKRNNIVGIWADPCYFNVIKDPHDPDPKRLYKALGELEGPVANHTGGVAVAFSPDGLHWTEYEHNPVVHHGRDLGDAPTMLGWDPKRGKYVGYYRPGHPLAPEFYGRGDHRHVRSYGYSESDDFIHWTPTRLMMTPDDQDRSDAQYMQFTAGIDGEFYIGFNEVYLPHEQTWDTHLMSSRDGFHWNWIDRNLAFIPRGEVGTYDAAYKTPCGPIIHDGKVWIYYGAYQGAHSYNLTKMGPDKMTIALCTLPENRWMGLLAGPDRATLVTRPLVFSGSKLVIDLDASVPLQEPHDPPRFDECDVRLAIEDQSGGAIAGFEIDKSTVVTTSGPQEITWGGADLSKLAGKPVRIRFEMRNATLYSFQFQ